MGWAGRRRGDLCSSRYCWQPGYLHGRLTIPFPSSSPVPRWRHLSWADSAFRAVLSNPGCLIRFGVKGLQCDQSKDFSCLVLIENTSTCWFRGLCVCCPCTSCCGCKGFWLVHDWASCGDLWAGNGAQPGQLGMSV